MKFVFYDKFLTIHKLRMFESERDCKNFIEEKNASERGDNEMTERRKSRK